MKIKKINKKLAFSKQTIATLDGKELDSARGGFTTSCPETVKSPCLPTAHEICSGHICP